MVEGLIVASAGTFVILSALSVVRLVVEKSSERRRAHEMRSDEPLAMASDGGL